MPEEFDSIESRLLEQFAILPDHEQVRFFVTLSMMLLDEGQLKSMIKILQERMP